MSSSKRDHLDCNSKSLDNDNFINRNYTNDICKIAVDEYSHDIDGSSEQDNHDNTGNIDGSEYGFLLDSSDGINSQSLIQHNMLNVKNDLRNQKKHVNLPKELTSLKLALKERENIHLQSADLFDNFSPLQKARQLWKPKLPKVFETSFKLVEVQHNDFAQKNPKELENCMPHTYGLPCYEFTSDEACNNLISKEKPYPLRVGIVLSGGPAPGGHNVIAGVFDFIRNFHSESQLYGFIGGIDGMLQSKYMLIKPKTMDRFRNQGGFDMLWSGRGKIKDEKDLISCQKICDELSLHGLVMIGGDGSLSNAAALAEYLTSKKSQCCVIGVPKTIDGDLKNKLIEASFGFDTASKTYSELVGNLCTDVISGQQVYHFVRIMGRSASHLVLECALQTHPNLVFIGEEIELKNVSLKQIISDIVQLIIDRKNKGFLFGIILVPEGLIEFIPEMKILISELNLILDKKLIEQGTSPRDSIRNHLSDISRTNWDFLPENIKDQLLLDRESTGYIQVSRIATEKLLKLLTELELPKQECLQEDLVLMTHYFGYEGRCAMPSNFDANYCYALGYTSGSLIQNRKSGYVSIMRDLKNDAYNWHPGALPFTRIMQMIERVDGSTFPTVTRQLVDLNGPLFEIFSQTREYWKLNNMYRCPGPIQFEGFCMDIVNYSVAIPDIKSILGFDPLQHSTIDGTYNLFENHISCLQKSRLEHTPELPLILKNNSIKVLPGSQYLPNDPYTQRQILLHYPYLCNNNLFFLQKIIPNVTDSLPKKGIRIGIVFVSRQSPGILNVLCGLYERLRKIDGVCYGFYGSEGFLKSDYRIVTDDDMKTQWNQAGMKLLGRATMHLLLKIENREKARLTCERLKLTGVILVGSSLALTEAAFLSEYFLSKGCETCVIGVPATGSNNISHSLIETNIAKVYASLIGNVLTDAASMPKYWHFVRLMGRQPSNEVLECALQTHPNVVIIAEEYGASNKTLRHVVDDISDVICKRAQMKKNFGTVLIPDGLLSHLPTMKALINELSTLLEESKRKNQLKNFQQELYASALNDYQPQSGEWSKRLTPWSYALYCSLPEYIRKELIQNHTTELQFILVETELLLSQMVEEELKKREAKKEYTGKFQVVCHYYGYQGRSSLPSIFDSNLAYTYGHLASRCIESGLTGYCCTVRGLCGEVENWNLGAIPFNSMLSLSSFFTDISFESNVSHSNVPIIPCAEVNLEGKAYKWLRTAMNQWQLEDRFCNPGKPAKYYHRILHEEQAQYTNMLQNVQMYTEILNNICNFGVDESFLKVVFSNLHSLLALRFHNDNLSSYFPQFNVLVKRKKKISNNIKKKY